MTTELQRTIARLREELTQAMTTPGPLNRAESSALDSQISQLRRVLAILESAEERERQLLDDLPPNPRHT